MVPAANPLRLVLTVTGELPLPMFWAAVLVPKEMVVPYSNETVVGAPLGVTVAFNVADVSARFAKEAELMDGRAVVELVPVVKRDSKAPCMARLLLSVEAASIRALYKAFVARIEEGV